MINSGKPDQSGDELHIDLQQHMLELRQSEEKFTLIFRASPVAMVLQREDDSTYIDVNEAFTEITGYSHEEAIGHKPSDLKLYPTREESQRINRALINSGGRIRNIEFKYLNKSGQERTGLLNTEVLDLGGVKTFLGIVTDITDRKQAEEEIQRLNAEMEKRIADRTKELSAFLDLAFLVSQIEDLDQIFLPALGRILDISEFQSVCIHTFSHDKEFLTLETHIGLEDHEIEAVKVVHPKGKFADWLRQPNDALLFSNLETETILPVNMRAQRFRSCLVTQLAAQGEILGALSCFRDDIHTFSLEEISLLVAISEQLGISLENQRLRQEAEKTAVYKERRRLERDLHDSITQSLYSLTLFARSGQDASQEGDQTRMVESLEQIEENAILALKEMRLLLYEIQPLSLEGGLASGIDARFDLVEHRLGIQTTCNIDNQILIHSPVEESLFHIILEALNNSLKHSQATEVSVNLQEENLILCLEVIDNGAGFRYQPGFEISGHAGLGLRNMKTRAKELGGELEIDTAPGSGTRIHLKITMEPEPNQKSG